MYFHNHGDPGPGVYLPTRWVGNAARFEQPGVLLPGPEAERALEPLRPEGFYRVVETFECCSNRCRSFEKDLFVQLGYDAAATPILFAPEIVEGAIRVPERGSRVDGDRLARLAPLRIPSATPANDRTLH